VHEVSIITKVQSMHKIPSLNISPLNAKTMLAEVVCYVILAKEEEG
jgi:hypothetical protein